MFVYLCTFMNLFFEIFVIIESKVELTQSILILGFI